MSRGNKTILTPALTERWAAIRRLGCSINAAAQKAGISDETARVWLRKAQAGNQRYMEFLEADQKAIADFEALNAALIQKAAQGGSVVKRRTITRRDGTTEVEETFTHSEWTAAAWLLERRLAEQWGRKETLLILQKAAEEAAAMDKDDALRMLGYEGPPGALPVGGSVVPDEAGRG